MADTLTDLCEKTQGKIVAICPKLILGQVDHEATSVLARVFSSGEKLVASKLNEFSSKQKKCSICGSSLGTNRSVLVKFGYDWEELCVMPEKIVSCCDLCNDISHYQSLMAHYMEGSMMESPRLSELITHFLTVNGHKSSEVSLFNAAVSLTVSFNTSIEKLKMTVRAPEKMTLSDLIATSSQ